MEANPVWRKVGLVAVVLVACAVRLIDFPGRYSLRDLDEGTYVQGGLALWEGITPTFDRTPAGPQTWISWAYAAGNTARYLVRPTAEERSTPLVLRPFRAGNHALFDIYRDWSMLRWVEVAAGGLVAAAGTGAAFLLGWKRGGWTAAALLGGVAAFLPLFIELSSESRPYAMAWGFAFISLYLAASSTERSSRAGWSAIFMGLAIGSRVDMLLLIPLGWADVWDVGTTRRQKLASVIRFTWLSALTAFVVAPWLVTDLIGNLRAIASVRIAAGTTGESLGDTLKEFFFQQGLGIDLALMLMAVVLVAPDKQRVRWAAGIFVLLLSISMLKGTGFGLRHQGAPIVAMLSFAAIGMAIVAQRWPKAAPIVLACALILPGINVTREIVQRKRLGWEYYATNWIERHVPSGTIVYLNPDMHDPLPTPAASAAIWNEVANPDAWKLKVKSAMDRFHVSADDYPRAFSESDMVVERGNRREWFILGSRPNIPDPRYDIHVFESSVVFRNEDVSTEFKRTGGVLVCNDMVGKMPTDVGTPVISWLNPDNQGIRIYCSPDLLDKLNDKDHLKEW
jgi:hypothetical protein